MKKAIFSIVMFVILFACQQMKEKVQLADGEFIITGKINNYKPHIKLQAWDSRGGDKIAQMKKDEIKIENDGSFSYKAKANVATPFLLVLKTDSSEQVEEQNRLLIFGENKAEIVINGDAQSFNKASVEGGTANGVFKDFRKRLDDDQQKIKAIFERQGQAADIAQVSALNAEYEQVARSQYDYMKGFVSQNKTSLVSAFVAVNYLIAEENLNLLEELATNTKDSRKDSQWVDKLCQSVESMKATNIGVQAPNFTLFSSQGKSIELATLKGKYVLIDFWASWCKPCRLENPNVAKLYQKYKNKNFEILGVSVDANKEDWQKAIEEDKIQWLQVHDVQGTGKEVSAIYNVSAIPYTLLIDPQGVIIAKNLRGEELQKKLAEVL